MHCREQRPFFFAQNRRFLRFGRKKPPWDASAPELTARLSRLMEQEAPYRDETLTLHRLAGMLGEESKRLSYHLNVNLSNTFRGYINELRPIAVCGDLLGNPRRAILDIAFSNGFNSKSSFSALFVRKYGQTSKEYRQKHLEHPDGTTRLSLENPREVLTPRPESAGEGERNVATAARLFFRQKLLYSRVTNVVAVPPQQRFQSAVGHKIWACLKAHLPPSRWHRTPGSTAGRKALDTLSQCRDLSCPNHSTNPLHRIPSRLSAAFSSASCFPSR